RTPLVAEIQPSAVVVPHLGFVDVEAAQGAAVVIAEPVAVDGPPAEAARLVGVERHGQVLALVDSPEERDVRVEALEARGAEGGKEEARLPLASDGGREERK